MKAIIMAGGEGTRLRPITSAMPKPMVNIIDKPAIAHIIRLLKENGINDVCITLRFLPNIIIDYLESNSFPDMHIETRIESTPLGTAGGVKACEDFLNGDDVLIMSGDAVCDFDLRSFIDYHYAKGADATIALCSQSNPTEYGVVSTDYSGKTEKFTEKPAWEDVYTDFVNTGIYILSNKIIEKIPKSTSYDFGKDLFPCLLQDGDLIFGYRADGYWCDIGNPKAYLSCCMDILAGKTNIKPDAPAISTGVWSLSPLPEDISIVPPVYIGEKVTVESGVRLGPGAVIGDKSLIESGAAVSGSVIDGASIKNSSSVNKAVICRGAIIGGGSTVGEGCVIGEGTNLGQGCIVRDHVSIWPGKDIADGSVIAENIISGMTRDDISFSESGTISGEYGTSITPEICASIGAAAAGSGPVVISWSEDTAARLAAMAAASGVCSVGENVIMAGSGFRARQAFEARHFNVPVALFISRRGNDIEFAFSGRSGQPIGRQAERKIEASLRMSPAHVSADKVGDSTTAQGITNMYTVEAAKFASEIAPACVGFEVGIRPDTPENSALYSVLMRLGFSVSDSKPGIVNISVCDGGLTFTAIAEDGSHLNFEKLLGAFALAELENGAKHLFIPPEYPAALDKMAAEFGAEAVHSYDAVFESQPYMYDGIFMAARLMAHLFKRQEPLYRLVSKAPRFFTSEREVALSGKRASVMRIISDNLDNAEISPAGGICCSFSEGEIRIIPCRSRQALLLRSECLSVEAADELCVSFEKLIRSLEKGNK